MTYELSDLYQAAFIIASGHPLVKMSGQWKKTFHFELPPTEIERLKRAWFFEGVIPALRFTDAIKNLKCLVNNP